MDPFADRDGGRRVRLPRPDHGRVGRATRGARRDNESDSDSNPNANAHNESHPRFESEPCLGSSVPLGIRLRDSDGLRKCFCKCFCKFVCERARGDFGVERGQEGAATSGRPPTPTRRPRREPLLTGAFGMLAVEPVHVGRPGLMRRWRPVSAACRRRRPGNRRRFRTRARHGRIGARRGR